MNTVFIAGIGTEVGKTVVSSWLALVLGAAYWKPIQSGSLHHTDADEVRRLTGGMVEIFPSAYDLSAPISPHAAAAQEQITVTLSGLMRPTISDNRPLIIESAGGLLSPINDTQQMVDMIAAEDLVLVVSKHYLGSINHTLLTCESLKHRGIRVAGLIFVGAADTATEDVILKNTGLNRLVRLPLFDPLNFETLRSHTEIAPPELLMTLLEN